MMASASCVDPDFPAEVPRNRNVASNQSHERSHQKKHTILKAIQAFLTLCIYTTIVITNTVSGQTAADANAATSCLGPARPFTLSSIALSAKNTKAIAQYEKRPNPTSKSIIENPDEETYNL